MTAAIAAALVVAMGAAAIATDPDPDPLAKLRAAAAEERLEGVAALLRRSREELAPRRASLRTTLRKLLEKDPAPRVRAGAARALARLEGDDAVPALLGAIEAERDPDASRLLPEAFEELPGDSARLALARVALGRGDPRAAALAAECLGFLPAATGFDDLAALLDAAPHWAVAAGACLGAGRIVDVRSIDLVLPRLRHPDPAVRCAARESLVRLSGDDLGTDPAKWEEWWRLAKPAFRFPDAGPQGPSMRRGGTADRPMGDGNATFARFFGVELKRRRTAFLVDYSQSMWGPRRAKAEEELVLAAKGLPSTHTFAVVLFNERVWWFRGGPLPARPQEKLDLERYLSGQETKSYTNIYDALEQGLALAGIGSAAREDAPGLDELVLLSDGVPNRGKLTDPPRILEAVRTLNSGRVVLHTVSLGDGPSDLLRRLAEENGGRFVASPFPK